MQAELSQKQGSSFVLFSSPEEENKIYFFLILHPQLLVIKSMLENLMNKSLLGLTW